MHNPIPTILESLALAGGRVLHAAEKAVVPDLLPLDVLPEGIQPQSDQPERIQIGPTDC